MLRKIRLTDYMSHAASELDLAPGLTVLVGPNNCGKSAVVSALEAVARNQPGDYMIRHGAKLAEVAVELGEGEPEHTIAWRRKNAPSYVIDGVEHTRVQRSVPEAVHEHLRMPLVESEDGKRAFDVHFGKQKEPIFLLHEPESAAATFFAASSDASRLIEMQHRHRENVKDRKREHARVLREIDQADRELAALAAAAALRDSLAVAETEARAIEAGEAQAGRLAPLVARIERLAAEIERARARAAALADLDPTPALAPEADLRRLVASIEAISARHARAKAAAGAVAGLEAPPAFADPAPL
ncbi:MAG TPA: AAA family ATPase, partial [Planctomycetota bacterium]|nr:AAA family ATPase [Planctomycetota bacterium]